jgi:hypothetical protein
MYVFQWTSFNGQKAFSAGLLRKLAGYGCFAVGIEGRIEVTEK